MKDFIRENKTFSILFLIAVIIRFVPLFSYQYSYDELCGLRNSVYPSWRQMIDYGVKLDTHPVLVQLIINITVKLFGYAEYWVKLPFLFFSLAAIIYAYLFAKKWLGDTAAFVSTSIFSFSYIFLFYAPLARMYAGGLFFSTALMYYFFEICFKTEVKKENYFLFVFFIICCALNNHLSALFAFTVAFSGLFFQNKESVMHYLVACLAALILYLPHLSITMWQFAQGGIGHGQDGWLPVPDKWVLFSFLKTLLGTGDVWIAFALLLIGSLLLNKLRGNNKIRLLLIFLFLANYAIIHAYSVYKAPIMQNSVMLFSAPCFIWLLVSFFQFKKNAGRFISYGIAALLLVQSVFIKNFFSNAVLNQNAFQSEQYVRLEDQLGKGKIESYYLGSQRYFVIEYELKYKRKFNYYIGEDFEGISDFARQISQSKASFILLGEPDRVQLEIAKEYFPEVVDRKQTLNVNYYRLSKRKQNIVEDEKVKAVFRTNEPGVFEFNFTKEKSDESKGSFTFAVDSLNEFCFSAKSELKNLPLVEGNVILVKIKAESDVPLQDVGIHFSIKNGKDSTLYFGGTNFRDFIYRKNGTWAYAQLFIGSEYKNWISQSANLTCFVWNRSKSSFNITDFELELINYWPERWSWWD